MNNKILLIITILLIPIAVISFIRKETNFNLPKIPENQEIIIRLKITETGEIIHIPLEEYLIGVVAAEMPALFHIEALKAQAIAARTFALSRLDETRDYDLVDTINDQAYITTLQMREKWGKDFDIHYNTIRRSVEETKNLVMTYDGNIIRAFYFAMSNGYTEYVELVFGESRNYLRSVESIWDNETLNRFVYETKILREEFCEKLEINCQYLDIEIIDRSNSNRVNELEINGNIMKGTDFRRRLGLRSTDFNITLLGNYIHIETRGHGHGVGMSQHGANGMARSGKTYEEILKHYYQNIKIVNYFDV